MLGGPTSPLTVRKIVNKTKSKSAKGAGSRKPQIELALVKMSKPKNKKKKRTKQNSGLMRLSGKGDYLGDVGGRVGSYIGTAAGNLLSKIIGAGDYVIKQNTLVTQGSMNASFGNDGREVRIRHHEYIGDVLAHTDFTVQTFSINPGLPETMPWIAQVAPSFQQWRPEGMVFMFRSMAATFSGDGIGLGTVVMGTQYDITEPIFADKRTMEQYEFSNSCKPSDSMIHPIECAQGEGVLDEMYIRVPDQVVDSKRFYDQGNFSIAVVGTPAASEGQLIGELWIAYDIRLLKPRLSTLARISAGDYVAWSAGAASSSFNDLLGPDSTPDVKFGDLDLSIISYTANQDSLQWPDEISSGMYRIEINWRANESDLVSTGTTFGVQAVTFNNCELVDDNYFYPGVALSQVNTSTAYSRSTIVPTVDAYSYSFACVLKITGPGALMQLNGHPFGEHHDVVVNIHVSKTTFALDGTYVP